MIAKPQLFSIAATMICATFCGANSAAPLPLAQHQPAVAPTAPTSNSSRVAVENAPNLDVANNSTACGEVVKLHALFRRAEGPINGASLHFKIGPATVGQGVTDASGVAEVEYKTTDNLAAGEHSIQVMLPANGKAAAISGSGKLTVMKGPTNLNVFVTTHYVLESFSFVKFTGKLTSGDLQTPLANQTVLLKHLDLAIETVTTSKSGAFSFNPVPSSTKGHDYKVVYGGNANCMASTYSKP